MNNLTQEQKVSIYFVMDNEDYAFRTWFHVPSVGDEVMLSDNKVYRVVRRCNLSFQTTINEGLTLWTNHFIL